jgi:phospholipid/cholesterol/gamma-HCH transport system substrate-binding protein
MSRRSPIRDLWVGTLVLFACFIFLVLLISVGTRHNVFSPKIPYHARFESSQGLAVGAPVRLEGVPIGSVSKIAFPEDPNDFQIIVTIEIERDVAPRIREDTTGYIAQSTLLGDVLLELEKGSSTAPALAPEAFIRTKESPTIEQFKSVGETLAANVLEISTDLRSIVSRLEEGEGVLPRLLRDPEYGASVMENVRGTAENVDEISARLAEGESFLGQLATGPEGADAARRFFDTVERLDVFLARVEGGEGALGMLMQQGSPAEEAMEDLASAARSFREFADSLEVGEGGIVPRLLADEELAEALLADLRVTASNLASISTKLDEAEGTLGLLLEDPSVYEGLEDVVSGVQENKVLRWYIRRQQRKGAQERLTGSPAEEDEAPRPAASSPGPGAAGSLPGLSGREAPPRGGDEEDRP